MHNRILRVCWAVLAVAFMLVSTAKAQTSCSIGYSISSSWSGGFNGGLTIYNTGTTAISSWGLGFAFANGQVVSSSWNSTYAQSGANVTLTNVSYNGSIAAGSNISGIGFTASWNNTTNSVPTAFALNGVACSIAPTAGTFTLSGPSSVSVQQGSGGGGWININGSGGFNGTVSFSVSGLPTNASVGISPNPGSTGTWLQFSVPSSVTVGSYPITATGTSGSLSATTSFPLIVQAPASFTLNGPSSISVQQGSSAGGTVNIVGSGGFNSPVTLSASGLPSGVTVGYSANPATGSTGLQFYASSTAATGTSTVTITGTSGSLMASTGTALTVAAPCTPTAITPWTNTNNSWVSTSTATVTSTSAVVDLGPQPTTGTWSWTGPNGFTSNSREIDSIHLNTGSNVYIATYTNSSSCKSTQTFSITVGTVLPQPTIAIVPDETTHPYAENLIVTAAVSGSGGTPTGSVVLSSGSYTSPATTLSSSGSATFYIQPGWLPAGSNTVPVTYSPDSKSSTIYAASANTVNMTIATPGSTSVAVNINPLANRHLISPYIYGLNTMTESDITNLSPGLVRFGGNEATNYNWKLLTYNAGGDWYFEDFGLGGVDSVQLTQFTTNSGSHMLTTMPMLSWVAKQSGSSFSVAKYGAQCQFDPYNHDAGNGYKTDCTTPVTTQPATDAYYPLVDTAQNCPSGTTDGSTCLDRQTWAQALSTAFGNTTCNVPYSSITSCHFYDMDNEPEIWGGSHRDVHPTQTGYSELANLFEAEGTALKSWDSSAIRFGPITCCYSFLWTGNSPTDGRSSHANVDFVPWWLNHVNWQDQINGARSLDAFDIHAYFSDNINNSGFTNPQLRSEVAKYVRTYWDPTYYTAGDDANWITTTQPNRAIPFLIPRLKALVNAIYPGTPLSFTEWESFFTEWEFATALSDADAYGTMGREGLSFSTRWGGPSSTDTNTNQPHPNYQSFKLWTNYDGAHHGFGTLSVSDQSSANPDQFLSFAALNSTGTTMTIMVLNKDPDNTANVTFNLNGFTASTYTAYTVGSTNPSAITSSSSQSWSATQTFPPYSITLLVVNGTQSPAPVTEWYMKADDLMIPAGGTAQLNPSNYSGSTNVTVTSAVFDAFEGAPACNGSFAITSNTIYQYWPAFITATAPTAPGFCHYTVTGNDGTATSTQSGWIVVGNPSGTLTSTGSGQSGNRGTTLSQPLTITLNPGSSGISASGAEIFFTTSAGSLSNGTTSGAKVIATTNASGVASVTLTLPSSPGTVTVTAQDQFAVGGATTTYTETAQ